MILFCNVNSCIERNCICNPVNIALGEDVHNREKYLRRHVRHILYRYSKAMLNEVHNRYRNEVQDLHSSLIIPFCAFDIFKLTVIVGVFHAPNAQGNSFEVPNYIVSLDILLPYIRALKPIQDNLYGL